MPIKESEEKTRLRRISTIAIVLIMTIVVGFALYTLKAILMPFIVAILLAYLFSPAIEKMAKKFRIPRSVSIIILFIIIFILATLLGAFLVQNINEFVNYWPTLQVDIETSLMRFAESTNLEKQDIFKIVEEAVASMPVGTIITSSFAFFGNIVITLLFMAYILFSIHTIPSKLYQAFNKKKADNISRIIKNINEQVQKYLVIKTIISFLTGVSVYLILAMLDIKFAFLWGAIAFFLNYIPNIGSILAGLPPTITAYLQDGTTKALIVLVVFVGVQIFWGNIIEPLVIGKRLNLSPIVVLMSLLFWGWLWGVVGAIISVPLMAIIKIVSSNIEGLKPIAVLISEK